MYGHLRENIFVLLFEIYTNHCNSKKKRKITALYSAYYWKKNIWDLCSPRKHLRFAEPRYLCPWLERTIVSPEIFRAPNARFISAVRVHSGPGTLKEKPGAVRHSHLDSS